MDSAAVSIFNQLIGQYNGSISAIQTGSIAIGKELFNAIATISVAMLGIERLLNKNIDMTAANIELIRLLIYMNVFYLFITQYDQFLPFIMNSFKGAGIYMGSQASGYNLQMTANPGDIINIGVSVASKILNVNKTHTLLTNIGLSLVSVASAGVILFCFGSIAVELILIDIGSRIILAGGIFLLAFAGSPWTREYAEHYIHTFFHLGIKMLFVYVLVGVGAGLAQNWPTILDNAAAGQIIEYFIGLMMASFVYYKLCLKLPDQAVVYLSGRLSMSYDSAASVSSFVKGVASVPKKTFELGKQAHEAYKKVKDFSTEVAANRQGDTMAKEMAGQAAATNFQAQGKTPTPQELNAQTVKTLGEARRQVKQAAWDKQVDDTLGGKVAAQIVDNLPPTKESK